MRLRAVALALLVAAAAVSSAAFAQQEPEVRVSVDKPRPAANEIVRLTYAFSGSGLSGDVKVPSQLGLKNLTVVGGPSMSRQISFINFQTSQTLTFTYFLRPQKEGGAEVAETTWQIGDTSVKAAPYVLEVGPARQGAGVKEPAEEEDDDPFRSLFPRSRPSAMPGRPQQPRDYLVKYMVTPDRTSAYVGEEITLHYELITQADVQGLEYVDVPKFPGLWAEDLEKPERPHGRTDTYDNRRVTRFTLLKKVVSGLSPGTVTIPPAKVKLAVTGGGDPFFDPFSRIQPQVVQRETEAVTLKILPIPGSKSFKGAVGRFDVSAKVDKTRTTVGDAVNFRVRIAGTGNLRTLTETPRLEIPNVKVYPPTVKADNTRSAAKSGVFTEWDYVLVPSSKGAITIPPLSFEVFDPVEKKVVTKSTAAITLAVDAGSPETAAGAGTGSSAATEAAPVLPTLAPEKSAGAGSTSTGKPLDLAKGTVTVPLWLLAVIPGILVIGGGLALLARSQMRAKSELYEALRSEPDETKERASARMDRALRDALHRRYKVPDGLASAALLEALASAGVSASLIGEVKELFERLDFLRFAPQLGEYEPAIREAREMAKRLFGKLR